MDNKERAALSLLLGLRQKFAREIREGRGYTALELHIMLSESIKKISSDKLICMEEKHTKPKPKQPTENSKIWGEVDEQIERSKIRRYDWKKVFGHSLTKEILRLKKSGLDVEDAFTKLLNNDCVIKFLEENDVESKNIVKNLKISIHARFGENNTAKKVEAEKSEE